jgi:hypothetical protein
MRLPDLVLKVSAIVGLVGKAVATVEEEASVAEEGVATAAGEVVVMAAGNLTDSTVMNGSGENGVRFVSGKLAPFTDFGLII